MNDFWNQYKALLYRNLLFKKRNLKQFSQELFLPIYFICILAMIKNFIPSKPFAPVPISPSYSLDTDQFQPSPNMTVHVSPNTSRVREIMDNVAGHIKIQYTVYPTSDDALVGYEQGKRPSDLGVVFDYGGNQSTFAIRAQYEKIASTAVKDIIGQKINCREDVSGNEIKLSSKCPTMSYLYTGFSVLQTAISTAMLRLDLNATHLNIPQVSVRQIPKQEYMADTSYIQIISSIYFIIAFSPLISFLTLNLVTEKEKKIKEGMRMMGMRDSAFWCAWSTIYVFVILFISIIIIIIAVAASFFSDKSNFFIFFLMLFFYGLSIINLAFMISPFFNKATTAGTFASFTTMIISLFYLAISLTRTPTADGFTYSIPPWGRGLLCLFSPVAFALAIDQGLFLDLWKDGMTFANIDVGDFPLYACLVMLVFDIFLYGFLAIYFENVIPGEFGQRRPVTFFLKPSYWRKKKENSVNSDTIHITQITNNDVEPIAEEFVGKEGIIIQKIRKVFKKDGEDFAAIDNLSLDIYEGQITALLGHNGAGKTTLINMLVGLTPVTSGNAWLKGLSVTDTNSMDEIRTKTGVCPQHNLLLDDITCREHLMIFAGFKGIPAAQKQQIVEEALESVDLTDKANTIAKNLSGGQKRKLSVAIALMGDPKVLFLDEPTAGMDPYSRRHLWSLLQSKKEGRIILLTTHFMDEADILADRKAIISKGALRCCGSSLFLKNRFGIGYHLNMVAEPNCDVQAVTKFLKQFAPHMKFIRSHGSELSYTLPFRNVSAFAGLFIELERTKSSITEAESLGISSYGVSMTTLEEVFLKLAENDTILDSSDVSKHIKPATIEPSPSPKKTAPKSQLLSGSELTRQRFYTLIRLRFLATVTEITSFVFLLILPVIFIIIGVVLSKLVTVTNDAQQPKDLDLKFTLGVYAKAINFTQSRGPPMLFQDSSAAGSGQYVEFMYQNMSRIFKMDKIDNTTDLLDIGQHYVGINVSELQPDGLLNYNLSFTALFNFTAAHAIPATINLMSNFLGGFIKRGQPDLIEVHSLPWNATQARSQGFNNNIFSATILIAMAFISIAPGFALHVIKDKECKARSLLRVSGVTVNMYWASMFVYSCLLYMIPLLLTIIVILIAQLETYSTVNSMVTLVISLLLYMPTSILFSFNLSFLFKAYESSASILPNIFIFGSLIPYLAVSLVDMISSESTASYIHLGVCIVDPPYIIFGVIYYIDKVYRVAHMYGEPLTFSSYYTGDIGKNVLVCIVVMIAHIAWLGFFLRVLEVLSTGGVVKDACRCDPQLMSVSSLRSSADNPDVISDEDDDVKAEHAKVLGWMNTHSEEGVVSVRNLRKEFKASTGSCQCCKKQKDADITVAVRNETFGVGNGQVFGLLGPNGAGKTTVLNMIMADIGPTCGVVSIAGYDIQSSLSEAFQALGVCPQHDALWDLITLRQHLITYALIEGVPRGEVSAKVQYFLDAMQLVEHADKKAKKLSGGTKRKLSFAISMMGDPRIVLMDEPSTGMDPQSKRFFWDTISASFTGTKRGAILTTHYMEEADALCSRVAIMVNGHIQCIGSTQHLKDKFGSGYILEVKVSVTGDPQKSFSDLDNFVTSFFKNSVCSERFGDRIVYKIPQASVVSLGKSFEALEGAKTSIGVSEYSFSQSSLEQVFLDFAKKQVEEGEKVRETTRNAAIVRDGTATPVATTEV